MTATETLRHEHQVILHMLRRVEEHVGAEGGPDRSALTRALDFFTGFVDRCHHAKEERHLFPRLVDRGLPLEEDPLAVMLQEHEQGRALVRATAAALDEDGEGAAVTGNLLEYVELLRGHIGKEDNVLFPLADRLLSETDQLSLAREFERVEAEELGEGVHEQYHHLAHVWPGD